MKKSCIYYTHNLLEPLIMKVCQEQLQEQLRKSFNGEIVSVSLKPMNFGKNVVLKAEKGVITMFRQILLALETSTSDIIFFCEHDCLYHKTHFDFTPPKEDIFYYNTNVYRWDYPKDRLITYDHLKSLSGLCVNRELALKHYKERLKIIEERGFEEGRDPNWARKMGYEPGKNRSGLSKVLYEEWKSEYPNVDIRHKHTITPPKTNLDSFKHKPINWQEVKISEIPGWDLKTLFDIVD